MTTTTKRKQPTPRQREKLRQPLEFTKCPRTGDRRWKCGVCAEKGIDVSNADWSDTCAQCGTKHFIPDLGDFPDYAPTPGELLPETQAEAAAKEAALDRPSPQRARPAASVTSGDAVPDNLAGERLVEIKLTDITPAPFNPRQEFAPAKLKELADSMKRNGVLQPIEVRANGKAGHYELIAGERRWRAAKLARLETIPCRIVDITDEEAIEHCLDENLKREDLNPIEKARAVQLLLDRGLTQAAAAKRLGYGNASQVANEVALLKLPADWQAAIISQEIPPTHTRHVMSWRERPAVMERILKLYRDAARVEQAAPNQRYFERIVDQALQETSKSLSPTGWPDPCNFKPTPAQLAELDVVEVKRSHGAKERRAFNVTLWNQLNREAKKRRAAREKKAATNSRGASPAAPQERDPQTYTVRNHQRQWFAEQFAAATKKLKPDVALKLLFTLQNSQVLSMAVDALAAELTGAADEQVVQEVDLVRAIVRTDAKDLQKRIPALVNRAFTQAATKPAYGGYWGSLESDSFAAVAPLVGVDYAETWKPTREVLLLYPEPRLRKWAKQHGVDPKLDKGLLADKLAAAWPAGEFPPGFEPEQLVEE